jgi:YHS domain-containing protein
MLRHPIFLFFPAAGSVVAFLLLAPGCTGSVRTGSSSSPAAGSTTPAIGNPHPGYCPVMGLKVDVAEATHDPDLHTDCDGKRYLFCCGDCKPKFEKEPAKYIAHPADPKDEKSEEHAGHSSGHEH